MIFRLTPKEITPEVVGKVSAATNLAARLYLFIV